MDLLREARHNLGFALNRCRLYKGRNEFEYNFWIASVRWWTKSIRFWGNR